MQPARLSRAELDAEHSTLLPAREETLFDAFFLLGNASAVAIGTNAGTVVVINFFF